MFQRAGEFPTQNDPEFPMAPAARDYYRNGPSLLNQYVPFWITNSAQKIVAVLVAVFGIILPIAKFAPQIRHWYVRRHFQAWYDQLQALEASAGQDSNDGRKAEITTNLSRIEEEVCRSRLPTNFTAQTYSLRGHIELVRRKVLQQDRLSTMHSDPAPKG